MGRTKAFEKLLEPGFIGKVRIRNRMIKVAALHAWYPFNDGYVPEEMKGFYEALARGGAGLVVVAHPNLDYPLGLLPDRGPRIDDDKFIPGFAGLVDVIHRHGCPTFLQLVHMGPMFPGHIFGQQSVAASALSKEEHPQPHFGVPRSLTVPEVEDIVEKFVEAAERARKAGFDGVEVNAGHHHLLNSFVSAAWNKRNDAYGGSLENRARIMVDIVRGIKRRNGQDFPVAVLINGAEIGLQNGITVEEGQELSRLLEDAGADAIHVRVEFYTDAAKAGLTESTHFPELVLFPEPVSPMHPLIDVSQGGRGGWGPFAAAVKQAVSIPVIAIGGFDAELGEKALRMGRADFIGLNRPLQADPEFPNKVASGRQEEIAPCTSCLTCFHQIESFMPMKAPRCRVNTALGKEKEYEIKPADIKKRVMVVGGGPAGLEAARVAALRGHQVTLYDKARRLGGSMNVAAVVKGLEREDLGALIRYFQTQLAKLGVEVKLGKEVDRSLVQEVNPDVLIIAAGASHDIPDIPGIDKRNVLTSRTLHQQLKGYLRFMGPGTVGKLSGIHIPVGRRVVIVGGNIQGSQTAEFLVKRGRKVTIVETSEEIGEGLVDTLIKPHLIWWLRSKGTTMITGARCEAVTDKGLTIVGRDGNRQTLEADTIITALPLRPDAEILKGVEGTGPEVYSIGDCAEPALIVDAIEAGSCVGRAI